MPDREFTFVRGEAELERVYQPHWFSFVRGEVEFGPPYLWPNPYYEGGWIRNLVEVGSTSQRLDGSQHQQTLAQQWEWHLIWRRGGAVYEDLMDHILAMCGAETSWTDHLGNTETVNVASLEDLLLSDGATHEVTAVFREVTA